MMLQNLFIRDFRDMRLRIEKICTFIWNKRTKTFVGFMVFTVLIVKVFFNTTYLFRNTSYDRNHMVGIENENVDMVYIGGSAAFSYWEPLKAWNDCGFTSYLYATNGIQAENIKAYIKETQKTQNPKLYVVGVRAFQYYTNEQEEGGLRRATDSMDLTSFARYGLLKDYFDNRTITDDTDILSYYLDIAKYHTNIENLGSREAWRFINNNGSSPNKGWEWHDSYRYLEESQGFITDERTELLENAEKTLVDLLDYCKEEGLNVLFVVCPYHITMEDQKKYNTIGDIVKSYGFDYLNTNEYYDEMGVDFTTDFYDNNHVNLFGAAKYTEFLEHYILDNYDMPDHREDDDYSSWDEDYLRFIEEETAHAAIITDLRLDVEKGLQMADEMRQTQNLSEWYNLAGDERYTLFIATGDNVYGPQNILDQKVMEPMGLKNNIRRQIRIISNSEFIYSNEEDRNEYASGFLGFTGEVSYNISVEEGVSSILIRSKEVSLSQKDINIVVLDNNYEKVVDSVTLRCEDDGMVHIYRE